ncbi:MAG TPA: hypothetical protein VHM70_01895 [Polyangiaceae bacterium]|nr:hypothetical protein [Polyangiaceae bacterium]
MPQWPAPPPDADGGLLYNPCTYDEHGDVWCPGALKCDFLSSKCVECTQPFDCYPGKYCADARICVDGCRSDLDCVPEDMCGVEKKCTLCPPGEPRCKTCVGKRECPQEMNCVVGRCQPSYPPAPPPSPIDSGGQGNVGTPNQSETSESMANGGAGGSDYGPPNPYVPSPAPEPASGGATSDAGRL